jgi:hypothetical protein
MNNSKKYVNICVLSFHERTSERSEWIGRKFTEKKILAHPYRGRGMSSVHPYAFFTKKALLLNFDGTSASDIERQHFGGSFAMAAIFLSSNFRWHCLDQDNVLLALK